MKADFHMHTKYSSDSETEPRDMIEQAIRLGLETICFTDHFDKDFPKCYSSVGDFSLDTDAYFEEIKKLQYEYKDRINIRIGVELGLQPHLGEFYHDYVNRYPFDFVIGSVHVVDGKDPYYGEIFEQISDEEAYRHCCRWQGITNGRRYSQAVSARLWKTCLDAYVGSFSCVRFFYTYDIGTSGQSAGILERALCGVSFYLVS